MTCIVGLAEGGLVYMGGDSAGVSNLDIKVRADRKVFRNGPALFGFTSSFRMGQLLQHALTVPLRHPETPLDKFMVTEFVDAVRGCLKAGGFATVSNGVEAGGIFLVGIEGRLFKIDSDFQVGEHIEPYMAVGSGEDYALGALAATEGQSPQTRIETALAAAEKFSAGVRGPMHIEVAP